MFPQNTVHVDLIVVREKKNVNSNVNLGSQGIVLQPSNFDSQYITKVRITTAN